MNGLGGVVVRVTVIVCGEAVAPGAVITMVPVYVATTAGSPLRFTLTVTGELAPGRTLVPLPGVTDNQAAGAVPDEATAEKFMPPLLVAAFDTEKV